MASELYEVTPMWAGAVRVDLFDQALKDAGLDEKLFPRSPGRGACMARALKRLAPRGAKVDSLPKGMGATMSLKNASALDLGELERLTGVEVRRASSYEATLTARVRVENINGSEIETLEFTPYDHPLVPLLRDTYQTTKEEYECSSDLSVWFSQTIIPAVRGVGKRNRGGVYYVPGSEEGILRAVEGALASVSSSDRLEREINGVQAPLYLLTVGGKLCLEARHTSDSEAMSILIEGVIRQADSALDSLADLLENGQGGKPLGKRALAARKDEARALEDSLADWEKVCAVNLDFLRNRLNEVQAGIGMAELALDVEEG